MLLKNINPFIRFADVVEYNLSRGETLTYDCRFIYILNGKGKITLNGEIHSLSDGTVVNFQAGTLYRLEPEPSFLAIAIDYDFTQDYTEKTTFYPPVSKDVFSDEEMHKNINFDDYSLFNYPLIIKNAFYLRKNISELTEEYNTKNLFYEEKASLYLKNIFFEIARNTLLDDKKNRICSYALNYIYTNYHKSVSNAEIAAHLNLDHGYLNKIVKSCTGQTLHKHIMEHRINVASKLLLTTNIPLEEIAYETGFYNLGHFSSAFKRKTGYPPSYYRKGK